MMRSYPRASTACAHCFTAAVSWPISLTGRTAPIFMSESASRFRQDVPMAAPSLVTIARQVSGGERSARDAVAESLAAIEATNGDLNAFIAVDASRALADAEALDARIARDGGEGLPLAGVPLGV